MADVKEFYDSIASEYHSRYNIGDNPTYKKPIADYFRLQIVLRILAQNRCRSVFEVGVGDGTPLSQMSMMGLSVSGCDISERMVESTRNKLHNLGLSEPRIWKADISNAIELAPALMSEPVDALVALGVMPHVE